MNARLLNSPGIHAMDTKLPRRGHGAFVCSLAIPLLAALSLGCGQSQQDLQTRYGKRHGLGSEKSVNGTATLGQMFIAAGHRVNSWYRLSPRLQEKRSKRRRRAPAGRWYRSAIRTSASPRVMPAFA